MSQHCAEIVHISPNHTIHRFEETRWHHRLADASVVLMEAVCLCWLAHRWSDCLIARSDHLTALYVWLLNRGTDPWERYEYDRFNQKGGEALDIRRPRQRSAIADTPPDVSRGRNG